MPTLRRILKYTTIAVVLLGIVSCGGLCLQGILHKERGENLSRVEWLPQEATNVSFLRSYSRTAFEFDIDERGYREWVDYPVQEIEEPFKIFRYSLSTDNRLNPRDLRRPNYPRATIEDGLFYEERRSNGGGVATAYDRSKGRAYFESNLR
jgi:hypothetical protein